MRKRRYEILLPVHHNDGRAVNKLLLDQTREDLVSHFAGLTLVPHTLLGIWVHDDMRYEEQMRRLVVDVDELSDHEDFLAQFKRVLLERFEQVEIYIASYPIDIV